MTALLQNKETGSLRSRVFAALEQAIINGEYKEGDTLNELKLCTILGVSRTPIREALTQLEREGLVETIPNKGAVVVGISAKDVEDIYTIRLRLEGFAAELAAKNMTPEQKNNLEQIIELQEFYSARSDMDHIRQLDADFHNSIYEATDNRSLCAILTSFHNQIQRGRSLSLGVSGRSVKSISEHRKIMEAIKASESELAGQLMTAHIKNAFNNFKDEVEGKQGMNL